MQRDQRSLSTLVIPFPRERRVLSGEHLQRKLPCALLVAATEMASPLPDRRLDEFERDLAAGENRLERTGGAAIFETARGALLRHRLGALDPGAIGVVRLNPSAQRKHVDALLRAGTDGRDIDRVDELRRGAVVELDDGKTAMNTRVDAQNSDHVLLLASAQNDAIAATAAADGDTVDSEPRIEVMDVDVQNFRVLRSTARVVHPNSSAERFGANGRALTDRL
jgi:hypothetical protein